MAKPRVQPIKKAEAPANPYLEIEKCPKPQDDFNEWIKFQKTNWRQIRKKFKAKKDIIDHKMQDMGTLQATDMTKFLK